MVAGGTTGAPGKNGCVNGGGKVPSGNGGNMGGGTPAAKKFGGINSDPSGGNCFGSGHLKLEKSFTESCEPLISSNGITGGTTVA